MCEQYSFISEVVISSFNDKIGILFRKREAAEEALKCDRVGGAAGSQSLRMLFLLGPEG